MGRSELNLAPYATREADSKGRTYDETTAPGIGLFDLDRQRIMGCTAFRRLQGKTQVFAPSYHDHFRTRLTHSLEVALIARRLAVALGVNETLCEAIALAHDLGHPPFGHAGEAALDQAMHEAGGFNHNAHSVRVVTYLEHPYPAFRGLNLTYETLAGLGSHETQFDRPADVDGTVRMGSGSSVETQIVSVADRVAFDMHDLEDAIGAGFVEMGDVADVALWRTAFDAIPSEYRKRSIHALRRGVIDSMVDAIVGDVVAASKVLLAPLRSVEDVAAREGDVVVVSDQSNERLQELELFLRDRVYRRPEIAESDQRARSMIFALFEYFRADPTALPERFAWRIDDEGPYRVICDYVAGMTDRFCTAAYEKHIGD